MSYDKDNKVRCDGCRVPFEDANWVALWRGVPNDYKAEHYHQHCWQTGWYTGIEPKGEWPTLPDMLSTDEGGDIEPTFDHIKGEVRTVSSTGGEKGVKPARFDLLPVGPLTTVAKLYGKGAEKYEDHNWRRGYEWSKSYAALMRHATQFWGGEDIDPDTGLPHMASVVFHALALIEYMDEHPAFDDRHKRDNGNGEQVV